MRYGPKLSLALPLWTKAANAVAALKTKNPKKNQRGSAMSLQKGGFTKKNMSFISFNSRHCQNLLRFLRSPGTY